MLLFSLGILFPGIVWVVLRGMDSALDVHRLQPLVSAEKQQIFNLGAMCETCNKGMVKVFQEDVVYLITNQLFSFCMPAWDG